MRELEFPIVRLVAERFGVNSYAVRLTCDAGQYEMTCAYLSRPKIKARQTRDGCLILVLNIRRSVGWCSCSFFVLPVIFIFPFIFRIDVFISVCVSRLS
jgi:hypothetical protein